MPLPRAVLALTLICSGLASAQTVSFRFPVKGYVSGYSRATSMCQACFATADFNGDGKADIVYAVSEFTPFAGVVFGNGDGSFRPGPDFPINDSTGSVFVGDFNGDGKPDAAIGPSLYINDGMGNFGAPIRFTACAPITTVADFDGDGRQDLTCGTSVFLSNGNGAFRATAQILDGQTLLTADFNRDGKADLLLTSGTGQLAIAPGRGDGTFGPGIAISGSTNMQSVRAGDFNGDGNIDLVGALVDDSKIAFRPGRGDGSFGPVITTAELPDLISAVADFNRDGNLDLVAGDAVLAGNGDGTFRFPVFIGVVTQPCGTAATGGIFTPCDFTRTGAVIADFNGDNLPDIAAGYVAQGIQSAKVACISILLNDSPGDGFATTGVLPGIWTLPVGPDSVVSAFGSNLAPRTEVALSSPLPDSLGGIRLHIRDRSHSGDMLAPLLYASPSQINYVLPSSDRYAWVGIERIGSPYVSQGMAIPIGSLGPLVLPFLYSVGDGLAAASAVRIEADGTQTPVAVTSCSGSVCSAVPIDVSGPPVYLSLYGTGFGNSSATSSSCTLAGRVVQASWAGTQNKAAGLDQINVILPRNLATLGEVSVYCVFETPRTSVASNFVKVNIQ